MIFTIFQNSFSALVYVALAQNTKCKGGLTVLCFEATPRPNKPQFRENEPLFAVIIFSIMVFREVVWGLPSYLILFLWFPHRCTCKIT